MTRQVTRLAQSVASRRGFFGQVARLGAGVAAGLACALSARRASAGYSPTLCYYACPDGSYRIKKPGKKGCKESINFKKGEWCVLEDWL